MVILVHAVYANFNQLQKCWNTPMKNRPFLFQIAANHTNDHDLLLLAIFIRGEDGYDKHKIIDRPLSQNKVHCLKYFCNWL